MTSAHTTMLCSFLTKLALPPHRYGWGAFVGVRSRILIWYFLLTAGITFGSVYATYKIFCNETQRELGGQLQQDVVALEQFLNQSLPAAPITDDRTIVPMLNAFTARQVPNPNRYFFVLLKDQVIHPSQPDRINFAQQHPDLIQSWYRAPANSQYQLDGYFIRVVHPLRIKGQQQGVMIAMHDASMRYQMAEMTLRIVIQVTLIGLILFSAVAWFTAAQVLAPLRQVTETARSISDTDLTQRLEITGKDEIAELTLTFNQMLDRLQAAFTSQQDFIKDVSHELRTPITIIQGHLELLGDDPQERQETVALVRDELKRMNRFVTDLLLLMRIERPNFLRIDQLELAILTEEIFAKAQGLAPRSWKLEATGVGEIACDRQRITQVVLNLAQNATQYTQTGDTIAIGSSIVAGNVKFWVRDTGEGISLEDQTRIFDRFARGSNSERRSEGSGLGLSIVQAITKAHHGRVELQSHLGEGSVFAIVFPSQEGER